jgi:hypothetical protein
MFNIYLTDEHVTECDPGVEAAYGRIYISDYFETFTSSLMDWNHERYALHWQSALRRILAGADKSVLITSYIEPVVGGYIMCWPLYRLGDAVVLQNKMLFFDQLVAPFDPERPWNSVPERQTVNPEGLPISEWVIDIESIEAFLAAKGA